MLAVQDAYAELGGGQGTSGSFYASIGGKARVSFSGVLDKGELGPLGKARPEQSKAYAEGGYRVGVAPMVPTITRVVSKASTTVPTRSPQSRSGRR